MDKRAIGVLDSGVGGLTIWQEILRELPLESTVYIGDSKNAPYGDRTNEEIFQLAKRLIQFLLQKDVKLIVIACNVITTTSLTRLRNEFRQVPIVGTVPVVKKAAEQTKKKKIGILSTNGTAKSYYQKHLIEQFTQGMQVWNLGTNRLVPLIEKGLFDDAEVAQTVQKVVAPLREAQVDVVALGCTHFPFLRKSLQQALGRHVLLLDSGPAVARQVRRILENKNALHGQQKSTHIIHTTGNPDILATVFAKANLPRAAMQTIVL